MAGVHVASRSPHGLRLRIPSHALPWGQLVRVCYSCAGFSFKLSWASLIKCTGYCILIESKAAHPTRSLPEPGLAYATGRLPALHMHTSIVTITHLTHGMEQIREGPRASVSGPRPRRLQTAAPATSASALASMGFANGLAILQLTLAVS